MIQLANAAGVARTLRAISRLAGSGRKDAGGQPAAEIKPPVEWVGKVGAAYFLACSGKSRS